MRISNWSSDVCSSDLKELGEDVRIVERRVPLAPQRAQMIGYCLGSGEITDKLGPRPSYRATDERSAALLQGGDNIVAIRPIREASPDPRYLVVESRQSGRIAYWPVLYEMRSEEHTSELQSLMRISYAVFCLNKK